MDSVLKGVERLYEVMKRLRAPDGCPWDRALTWDKLRASLLEESYELLAALDSGKPQKVLEEQGDLLLQVALQAQIAAEEGLFRLPEVIDRIVTKLIRRHPHVFGETDGFEGPDSAERTDTADKVLAQWDVIKRGVEGRKADSILDEVSRGMPALERAHKLQKKAAKAGFDWNALDDVWPKVDEELAELRHAVAQGGKTEIEDELGDLLFSIVNVARHLKVDPGVALTRTNAKFTARFKYVEKTMKEAGIPMDKAHLKEMDVFWEEAKRALAD